MINDDGLTTKENSEEIVKKIYCCQNTAHLYITENIQASYVRTFTLKWVASILIGLLNILMHLSGTNLTTKSSKTNTYLKTIYINLYNRKC